MVTYENSFYWHGSTDGKFLQTDAKPKQYKGYLIYERIPGKCWDVVKDGICVAQRAGLSGAKRAIDERANNACTGLAGTVANDSKGNQPASR